MRKRKFIAFLLAGVMLLALTACGNANNTNDTATTPAPTKEAVTDTEPTALPTKAPVDAAEPETAPTEVPAPAGKTISPLPVTIDMNNLTDCTVAVSIDSEDLSVDNTGARVLPVTVYTYDLYDMVDMAMLEVGDTIILRGEEVLVTDLVRTDSGALQINGGLDMGGYELITNEDTVYFETGFSDVKTYFALGKAVLNVSNDFIFIDKADPEGNPVTFTLEDLFTDKVNPVYGFTPYNTRIVIEGGVVTQMERIYTP